MKKTPSQHRSLSVRTLSIASLPELRTWITSKLPQWFPEAQRRSVVSVTQLGSIQPDRGIAHAVLRIDGEKISIYLNQQPGVAPLFHTLSDIFPSFRSPLHTVRPLELLASANMLVYQEVAGSRARDLLEKKKLSPQEMAGVLRLTGRWLKILHAIEPPSELRPRSAVFTVKDFSKTRLYPELRGLLPRINAKLVASNNIKNPAIVHGDPHLANIILPPTGGLGIIDFSESRRGNGWYDVGMFLVHLELALHPYFSEKQIQLFQETFLRSYAGRVQLRPLEKKYLQIYRTRAALDFYKLTSGHYAHPSAFELWMLDRLEEIIRTPLGA